MLTGGCTLLTIASLIRLLGNRIVNTLYTESRLEGKDIGEYVYGVIGILSGR